MRGKGFLFCALAVLATVAPAAHASDPSTITTDNQTIGWDGEVSTPTAPPPAVGQLCEAGLCDEFTFTVALGEDYWDPQNPGSIEVAINWTPYDGETDLDLYVFDSGGVPYAQAANVDSNAESIFLKALEDDTYTVRVVASTDATPGQPYRGLVQIEPARPLGTGDGVDLLPNLIALPPSNFHISTALGLIPTPENPLLSCYVEETVEDPAHPTRCLRFNQAVGNAGEGKLELRFAMQNAASQVESDRRLLQRIYNDIGGSREIEVDAYELHLAHGHVHYRGFGQSKLYPYDWATQSRLNAGIPASVGDKVGFCLIDVMLLDGSVIEELDYWRETGNGPRSFTFPGCNIPAEVKNEDVWMVMGVDVGWADVYGWNLPDQFIDITNVADGVYEIEQLANPNALDGDDATPHVLESTYDDNTASAIICLAGDSVTPVETAEQAEACAA